MRLFYLSYPHLNPAGAGQPRWDNPSILPRPPGDAQVLPKTLNPAQTQVYVILNWGRCGEELMFIYFQLVVSTLMELGELKQTGSCVISELSWGIGV